MSIPPFWGSPRKQELRSNSALFWAPLLILPPALKRWGSPRRQGLRSHLAHKWATSDFAPRSEAVGIPETAGVTTFNGGKLTGYGFHTL